MLLRRRFFLAASLNFIHSFHLVCGIFLTLYSHTHTSPMHTCIFSPTHQHTLTVSPHTHTHIYTFAYCTRWRRHMHTHTIHAQYFSSSAIFISNNPSNHALHFPFFLLPFLPLNLHIHSHIHSSSLSFFLFSSSFLSLPLLSQFSKIIISLLPLILGSIQKAYQFLFLQP